MDLVLAPFALLFLATLGIDFGVFNNDDDDAAADAAPVNAGGDSTGTPTVDDDDEDTQPEPDAAEPPDQEGFDPAQYSDVVTGSEGDDNLSPEAESALAWFLEGGNDTLDGSTGNDYAEGAAGDDLMTMRGGNDLAYGGEGSDTIDGGIGFDTLFGGQDDDVLTGNGGADVLHGDEGNDTISGGSGSDLLYGGAGDDVLYGLSPGLSSEDAANAIDGVDGLSGGDGNDHLILGPGDVGEGGAGDDLFTIDHSRSDLTNLSRVNDFSEGDTLEVQYTPQFDRNGAEVLPTLTLAQNSDNTGTLIVFNNIAIANVIGAQGLTLDQITLIANRA